MSGSRGSRSRRLAATLILPLLLSSCFTMALWGFTPEIGRNPTTNEHETEYRYDEDTEWTWALFFGRVLGTPFTLVLDCLTAPVQAFFFDED